MDWIEKMAEQRLREAAERGELDDLEGAGKPLQLDDDRMVPEELRTAYRLLKNAGYCPPEVQLRGQIGELEGLIAQSLSADERQAHGRRLRALLTQLSLQSDGSLRREAEYYDKLRERLSGAPD